MWIKIAEAAQRNITNSTSEQVVPNISQAIAVWWILQAGIILLFIGILWWLLKGPTKEEQMIETLKQRLAKGEITIEEYRELKSEIKEKIKTEN